MVPGLKNLPYVDRLRALRLWSLGERRNRSDLLEVFKMKQGLSAAPFDQMFKLNRTERTHGHHIKIAKQGCRLDIRKYFFSDRVVTCWNGLDKEAINTKTINNFKKAADGVKKAKIDFFTDYSSKKS